MTPEQEAERRAALQLVGMVAPLCAFALLAFALWRACR
jgi:hypothetical protein